MEMSEQKKSTKTPQTVDTIESFSNQISNASKIMIFDEFDIRYGAANKVVKQYLKNGEDLNNICSKENTIEYNYKNLQGPFLQ